MNNAEDIKMLASFDPNRKCFDGLGDGSCYLKLNTSETELANVLKAFAFLRGKLLEVTFRVVGDTEASKRHGNRGPKQKFKISGRKTSDK